MSSINYWCDDDLFFEIQQNSQRNFELIEILSHQIQVPKIIHFIWLGSQLPTHSIGIIEKCKVLHPLWDIRIWNDEAIDKMTTFENRDVFDLATNFGMKSDVARYEIIYQYGGVYADIDYEFVNPLDNICSRCSFFAGQANTDGAVEINNGLIGAVAGHPLLRNVIDTVKLNCRHMLESTAQPTLINGGDKSSGMSDAQSALLSSLFASFLTVEETQSLTKAVADTGFRNTIEKTGPGMLTRAVFAYLNNAETPVSPQNQSSLSTTPQQLLSSTVIFPVEVFSPVPNTVCVDLADGSESSRRAIEELKTRHVTSSTIAIHWWQKSWYKK